MEEKMKKMLFLMLFLIVLGAANVTSQVRIGGNGQPNGAAVLDLNATDAINNGTKTLALPRVSLTSTTDNLSNATLLNGMLVYNTNTTTGAGVYYWDTNKWIKVSDGAFTEVDGVIGNEVIDAKPNFGLKRFGSGTSANPYTLGIDTLGVYRAVNFARPSYNKGTSRFEMKGDNEITSWALTIGGTGAWPVGKDSAISASATLWDQWCGTTVWWTTTIGGANGEYSVEERPSGTLYIKKHGADANDVTIRFFCWRPLR